MVSYKSLKLLLFGILFFMLFSCDYLFDFAPPTIEDFSVEYISENYDYGDTVYFRISAKVKDANFDRSELFMHNNKKKEYNSESFSDELAILPDPRFFDELDEYGTLYFYCHLKAYDKAGNWSEMNGCVLISGDSNE